MAISIKGGSSLINEIPRVSNLKITNFESETIDIEYNVEDVELTICRQYLLLNGERTEITKDVGYEQENNIFRYRIKGLNKGTAYTIQIAASDGIDEGLSKAIHQSTKAIHLLGVRVMENNSNSESAVEYIEEAVGVAPATSTNLGGWAKKWPFNEIKLVGLKNGIETKDVNPLDKTKYLDGEIIPHDVDVMVKIPKIYWDFTAIQNGYELRISDTKLDDNYDCYAHKVGGAEKDYIYIAAYLGYAESKKLRSISGVEPTSFLNIKDFRNYAHNVGTGYQCWNWTSLTVLRILYLIAYKNPNSQEALGKGYTSDNKTKLNTGGTDTKGIIFGENTGKQQMCFLGIEDFWGNMEHWIDGIRTDSSSNILITPDNKTFNNNGTGYKNIGNIGSEITSGYINKVCIKNEVAFLPLKRNGSSSTYYADHAFDLRQNNMFLSGGFLTSGLRAGAFYCMITVPDNSGTYMCSRLVFLGD